MSFIDSPGPRVAEMVVRTVPALTVFASTLLMALPAPLAWGVIPQVPLLFVLIWASLAPRLMPAPLALVLGVLADLVTGLPLGINAFLFPAAVVAVRIAESRTEVRSLFLDWFFAAVVVLCANIVAWQMLAFTGRPGPLLPMLAQAVLTILAWPLVVRIAARIQRKILEA